MKSSNLRRNRTGAWPAFLCVLAFVLPGVAFAGFTGGSVSLSNGPVYHDGTNGWYDSITQSVNLSATTSGVCGYVIPDLVTSRAFHTGNGDLEIETPIAFTPTDSYSESGTSANAYNVGTNLYRIKVTFASTCTNIRRNEVTFYADTVNPTAPGTPAGPSSPTTCSTSLTWSWSAGSDGQSGMKYYEVLIGSASGGSQYVSTTTTSTSYTYTGSVGNVYYCTVRAVDNVNRASGYVSSAQTLILGATGAPTLATPTNNAACQPVSPTFQWSAGTNANSYNITVDSTTYNNVTSPYTLETALATSTTYSWQVTAVGSCGNATSTPRIFSVGPPAPGTPAASAPSNSASGVSIRPDFVWTSGPNTASFNLTVGGVTQSGVTSPYTWPIALNPGQTYNWTVTAVGPCGATTSSPAYSFVTNTAPTNVTAGTLSVSSEAEDFDSVGTLTVVDAEDGPRPYSWAFALPNGNAGGRFRLGTQTGNDIDLQVDDASLINDSATSYAITVTVSDADGLALASPVGFTVSVEDDTPPIVDVDTKDTTDNTPALTGTVNDTMATLSVAVGAQSGLVATNNGDGTWTLADNALSALADNRYDVSVTATDSSPNLNSTTVTRTGALLVDTSGPQAAVNTVITSSQTPLLTGIASDANGLGVGASAGVTGVTVTVDGDTHPADITLLPNWSIAWPNTLAEGTYNVQVTAIDALGNQSTIPGTNKLRIDLTAPDVSIIPLITNDSTPTLAGLVSDPDGVLSVTVEVGGTPVGAATLSGSPVSGWSIALTSPLSDGVHEVVVRAEDILNNTGIAANANGLIIDTAEPAGALRINGGAPITGTRDVTLALTYLDATAPEDMEMAFGVDGTVFGDYETFAATKGYTLADGEGEKTVYVRLRDVAGNVSTDEISASVYYDPIPLSVEPRGDTKVTANERGTLRLRVNASGLSKNSSYVWRFQPTVDAKVFTIIDDQDNADLEIVNVSTGNAGLYYCEVCDFTDCVNSGVFDVEVTIGLSVASLYGLLLMSLICGIFGALALRRCASETPRHILSWYRGGI